MLNIFRFRRKKKLLFRTRDVIIANKPEELRKLLSNNKSKIHRKKTGQDFLSYCLFVAIIHEHYECIHEILKAGAIPCYVGEVYPVMLTIEHGADVRILNLLLEYGANPDSVSSPGPYEPLYFAASFADLSSFRMLLLYGADPDYNCSHRDFFNSTPDPQSVLGMCLANNHEVQFVKLLIQFEANVHLPDVQKVLIQADNDATKLLVREKAHPRTLKSQCRISIRRLLKEVGKLCLMDQLEIPNQLVAYLQYHNELDYPQKLPRYNVDDLKAALLLKIQFGMYYYESPQFSA